ncbi:MAG: hypothetical protein ACYSU1_07040 [Planctomycetota bacterium]|jgi:hypothetical protein
MEPGTILSREDMHPSDIYSDWRPPWGHILGFEYPTPTDSDHLIETSALKFHYPVVDSPHWNLQVVSGKTDRPEPFAIVIVGPYGWEDWLRDTNPGANIEGSLMQNGIAFMADEFGTVRLPATLAGHTVMARSDGGFGTTILPRQEATNIIPLRISWDRGILVRVMGDTGPVKGMTVGIFAGRDGKQELKRTAVTNQNGFAWILHATDPGIRVDGWTYWVDLVGEAGDRSGLTYTFDLLPLRAMLNPEPELTYPLGVNRQADLAED